MTTSEVLDRFDYLIDLRGTPGIEDDEKLAYLNMAQLQYLQRLVPDGTGGITNFELDQNVTANLANLILSFVLLPSNGNITFAAINAGIQSISGDSSASLYRLLSLGLVGNTITPIKYTRFNNYNSGELNYFKKSSATHPIYNVHIIQTVGKVITINPDIGASIVLDVMKTPKIMTADNTPDFDDKCLTEIIAIALQYAQVATRDNELLGSIQNANISK